MILIRPENMQLCPSERFMAEHLLQKQNKMMCSAFQYWYIEMLYFIMFPHISQVGSVPWVILFSMIQGFIWVL